MYIPSHFRESTEAVLAEFIDAHSFGTLVTIERGLPFASHVPFLHDREGRTLHAHVARGNPQWQHVADNPEVLVIFLRVNRLSARRLTGVISFLIRMKSGCFGVWGSSSAAGRSKPSKRSAALI